MAYQVVVMTDTGMTTIHLGCVSAWAREMGIEIVGIETSPRRRAELRGHPKLAGLIGPAWGGWSEAGEPLIRYEDTAVYAALSI